MHGWYRYKSPKMASIIALPYVHYVPSIRRLFVQKYIPQQDITLKILKQPGDVECSLGSSVILSAAVSCCKPSFQWYDQYGGRIPKQNYSSLILRSVRNEDFGFYRLEIIDLALQQKVLTRWVEIRNTHLFCVVS